jgi:hypothetical protein
MATIYQKIETLANEMINKWTCLELRKTNNSDLLINNVESSNLIFGLCITLALGEGGELEFRLPVPSARKETKILCNHNASRSTKCVAKCYGELMNGQPIN